jgi:hypothetical protein
METAFVFLLSQIQIQTCLDGQSVEGAVSGEVLNLNQRNLKENSIYIYICQTIICGTDVLRMIVTIIPLGFHAQVLRQHLEEFIDI